MRPVAGAAPSTRLAIGTPRAWASAESVEIVGDFAPRSISEIIDDEIPLLAASIRSVIPIRSRRFLTADATCASVLSAIVDILASIVYAVYYSERYGEPMWLSATICRVEAAP